MNELARRVCELTGSTAGFVHVPYEEVYGEGFEDMRRRVPDITKIKTLIGWQPRKNLDDILKDVIRDRSVARQG